MEVHLNNLNPARHNPLHGLLERLFPQVRISIVPQYRPPRLGEVLYTTVEVSSKRNLEVSEARIDLVCDEIYTDSYTTMSPDPMAAKANSSSSNPASGTPYPAVMFPRRETEVRVDSFLHSSAIFAKNTQLRTNMRRRYNVKLAVHPEPPTHAGLGNLKWRLVTRLQLPDGREVRAYCAIDVVL